MLDKKHEPLQQVIIPGVDKFCAEYSQKKHLKSYVRDRKNRKTGVVIAYKDENGDLKCGWSKCKTKTDVFNKDVGFYIAFNRALSDNTNYKKLTKKKKELKLNTLPQSIKKLFADVLDRSKRYFK